MFQKYSQDDLLKPCWISPLSTNDCHLEGTKQCLRSTMFLQLQCTGEVENINAISSQVAVLTIAFLLTIKVNFKNLNIYKYINMIWKLTIICKWIRVDKKHGCLKLYRNEQSLLQFALSVRVKMEAKKNHIFLMFTMLRKVFKCSTKIWMLVYECQHLRYITYICM